MESTTEKSGFALPKMEELGAWHFLLILVLVVLLAGAAYLLYSKFSNKSTEGKGELSDMSSHIVSIGAHEELVYDGSDDESDDESDNDNRSILGSAEKKTAKKPAKKAEKKPAKKEKKEEEEKDEMVEEKKEEKKEERKFRGFTISERVVEKHWEGDERVTTMRASVRGKLEGDHRLKLKIKDVEGDEKKRRSLKIVIFCPAGGKPCEASVEKSKDYAAPVLNEEEREMAMRITHGALKSSMMDEAEHQKLADLVQKELNALK